ncbi:MAG: hypothetical protein JWO12_3213, partial [Frankiales bacterium]|nr:hypothetical protein [Frankiales bacterium]
GEVLVDANTTAPVPDGPECASTLLAEQLAHKPLGPCPSEHLGDQDARALEGLVGWLRSRGVTELKVLGDSTKRSVAAGLHVRGLRSGTHGALLLTGSWESAARELATLDRARVPEDGVYLAPWLLTGPILQTYATAAPLLALPFDPHSPDVRAYLATLPAWESPTGAGYEAFSGRSHLMQVWATSPASIFPKDLGHAHAGTTGWFPGGTLAAISRPLIT